MTAYINKSDQELVELLYQGDEGAFTAIYDRYWKKLFIIASNRLSELEEAEEIVQDIFVSLWIRRHRLNLTSTLSRYLAVSVKYRVFTAINKSYTQKQYLDMVLALDASQIDDSTQELLAFEELQRELESYVSDLPEKCQLVFRMSREQGYSQKQIAAQLQISEKTVEAHLGKAFKTLRTKLSSFVTLLL
ncbi:RNA polymerase sigma-70 factor [Sphingobacterium pedocola]|uniref:RNA polymerase sigma-70 factor n=1 Tax=Sphingobacterium pedocola TaxID=2082722 RepID=A0ABR9TAS4_9SPHI|nr:RNA polymerase sigma-70 factor [Sphingobacterium pedocola]MBE8721974.1 RNA polymerase sigma-70 factor [Sphingobacterium pedocola]